MGLPGPARPRVSRETRLLLATILISIAVLWALARIRFPNRQAVTNPVPPLLTQLAAPPGFDDLAAEVSTLDSRLLPSLAPVGLSPALRVRDAVGAILLPPPGGRSVASPVEDQEVLARDPASGLALISIPGAPAPELTTWTTQRPGRSRYMIASDVSTQGTSLRPVFIGRLHPGNSPAWPGEIWMLPVRSDVVPGEFLFMMDGSLAGLVIDDAGAPALVPGDTVLQAVNRLLTAKTGVGGWLGLEVQALPPSLVVAAPGAPGPGPPSGVMVAWVDPGGPASGKLSVMDVVETAGGEPIDSPEAWRVRVAQLQPAESIALRVRRRTETSDVALTAAARPAPDPATLGLTMRTVQSVGAEIIQVADGSAAARAGLLEGDVITAIGEARVPTAQQVARVFAAAPNDRPLLVAITRGDHHRVLAVEKRQEVKK